jgi:hypothetical protein
MSGQYASISAAVVYFRQLRRDKPYLSVKIYRVVVRFSLDRPSVGLIQFRHHGAPNPLFAGMGGNGYAVDYNLVAERMKRAGSKNLAVFYPGIKMLIVILTVFFRAFGGARQGFFELAVSYHLEHNRIIQSIFARAKHSVFLLRLYP